jgi:hypothetical protein
MPATSLTKAQVKHAKSQTKTRARLTSAINGNICHVQTSACRPVRTGGQFRTASLLTLEHALERLPASESSPAAASSPAPAKGSAETPTVVSREATALDDVCFYITPIGAEDSEQRMHSDLFLSYLVEPALSAFKLKVVRADQIGKPGMITSQVIDHILKLLANTQMRPRRNG